MNEFPGPASLAGRAEALKVRCATLVARVNLLATPNHGIWLELPELLARQLSVQLSRIHTNALSIQAWFDGEELKRPDRKRLAAHVEDYVTDAEKFIDTLEKTTCR